TRRPTPRAVGLPTSAEVLERDLVEAFFDSRGEVCEGFFGDRPARFVAAVVVLRRGQHDGAFERTHHVSELDLRGGEREGVATAWPTLGGDEARTLEILKDLLEEARRDPLAVGDRANLGRASVVVEGDVEEGAYPVATLVRELHAACCVLPHRQCQEWSSEAPWRWLQRAPWTPPRHLQR